MTITLEQIDELRRRANVSFEDAREALQECNGDLVEAIVYLEKNGKIKSTNSSEPKDSLWDKFKALVNKGNNTRFIMYKKDKTIINTKGNLNGFEYLRSVNHNLSSGWEF
jgi:ribosome recycling factor